MKRIWAFLPFALVGGVHLASLAVADATVSGPTKIILMPALLLAVLLCLPLRRGLVALGVGAAIAFSWAGDVLLSNPAEVGFLLGLGAFLLAHAAYLVVFLGPLRTRRIPWLAFVLLALWWGALVAVLLPSIGALFLPVAVYGFVLAASAAAALGTSRLIAIGALLFLASDTMLALRLFLPGFAMWQADFVIMLAYIAGQGLIGYGVIVQSRARADDREASVLVTSGR